MKIILYAIVLLTSHFANGQSYELINSIYEEAKDTIYLEKHFTNFNPYPDMDFISERFFREEWEPMKMNDPPDIELFLAGINMEHLKAFAHKKDPLFVDASKLTGKIVVLDENKSHLENNGTISQTSKPFISCSKEWAILFRSAYSKIYASSGDWYIYRKVDGKWVLFHTINIFMT